MSIPKIIHYCWLSGSEYPELVQKCIASWKKYLGDYEFVLWDQKRVTEIDSTWVDSAIKTKKWAFAADYIRLYALHRYGGIYLDCDVLVEKSFNDLLERDYFICREKHNNVLEAAVIGSIPNANWIVQCMKFYANKVFCLEDINKTEIVLPFVIKKTVEDMGLLLCETQKEEKCSKERFEYFSCDFFSPKDNISGAIEITSNTYCIHLFDGSWMSDYQRKYNQILNKYSKKYSNFFGVFFASIFAIKEKIFHRYSRI